MEWCHYLGGFCAGMFLANFVPHFVNGISGDDFPTPFSKPPGRRPIFAGSQCIMGFI